MKFVGLYKNSQVFKIALGIAIVFVGYIASVFYTQMRSLDSSVSLIANATETQLELEKVLSIISIYETNLRSFIITKDDSYLKNRFLRKGEIESNLKRIDKLVANNPARIKDVKRLKELIDYRFELFRETLLLAKSKSPNSLILNAKLQESNEFTEAMKNFVYKTINAEGDKVKIHNSNHQFELQDSIISAFLLVILSLLILLLSFNKMNVDIDELKKANDELKFLNRSFNEAEKIAGFGHWKVNLVTNTYTFSDNFYRLLEVEPQSFSPSLESISQFIHPDDKEYVSDMHLQSLKTYKPTSIMFRFILPSGEMKYVMSVGSFVENSDGEMVKTGVNYDMTDQFKRTLELEENNRELKSINEELESFNNIVSHDLQEPLHKIQMFISRIEAKENDALSDQGKVYFSKIRTSANKMQTLLIDLVNYSRTIKGDKVFEETNLNELVLQVIDDLSSDIEEKKAKITVSDLPTVKVISFQIEQLFINLISNSLKYCKENVAAQISIFSEEIEEHEIRDNEKVSNDNFYKIVIKDNGIGFKQEYADKIFILFQRLETGAQYSGTGLGLAICKRIVENHNGFIQVTSEPNVGSEFSIFIPKKA
ncbi:ATP-binding protein [Flavobacterium muglaense]|uniref:histidine kinase n=1 Tax=Flavobacterium muglaense TaxID=2764716 RepID=A0A923N2R0_9FLAO|nr:ATP-binding protein [Flavobacterium muglaense]MBC5839415.1 CHASE3 domain-containing protein [Flavobacterium muglaense]MBC5845927.1 CHASE3 domain-containing protein [Flavobacterium muglaense]